ncbi:MAG: hypothetical protein HFG51_15040 [Lachnospiraceae bacterium]|nr:hypothetical protein [Lachnospiraceae bacterium]
MGWKVGITTLKLTNQRSKKSRAKRTGYLRAVVCEGLSERWGKDEDIDRSRSCRNTYTGITSGVKLAEAMTVEAAEYSAKRKATGGRALRADAAIGWAMIIKPPADVINAMSPGQQIKFFADSDKIITAIMGADNIRATALHRDEQAPHKHYFGMGYTKSGELCVDKVINPKLYKQLNQEYPQKMREMGWDIEDCTVYDSDKVKSMTEDEAAAYKRVCKAKRQQKKSGVDSKTYKAQQELQKIEKEKDRARLSRDLALAAAQQAKQQTATVHQEKAALETNIADLKEQVDSYPTDLQDRLDALTVATDAYHNAASASESGPLIEFLHKIKVNQKQPDGSTIKRSVYDVWEEYRQKQEHKLAAQAKQAQQEAQRRLPTFQSTAAQHGDSYTKNF